MIYSTYTFLFILTDNLLCLSDHVHARYDFTDVLFILVCIMYPYQGKVSYHMYP